jgi:tetratricopeptide (TPR) repeat protein
VAEALNVSILGPERKVVEAILTNNPEAYDYYLRAREYINRGVESRENLTMSIELFEKAVNLDTSFVQAYAGLAGAHAHMYWFHFDHSEERATKSKEAADKAIQLGSDVPEAHLALGIYYYSCRLDYDHALEQLSIALEKQPRNSDALRYIAYVKRRQGKLDEIVPIQKKALEIDPRSIDITQNIGDSYALLRDYVEAERYYLKAIAISPDYLPAYISPGGSLAYLYLYKMGDTLKTIEILNRASHKNATPDEKNWLHFLWATASILDKAYEEALRHIHSMGREALDDQFRFLPKSQLYAHTYGLMGEKQKEKECYDSARLLLENKIKGQPDDSRLYSSLGIAYAGLGLKEKAILEATRATEILPVSKEYWRGIYRVRDLAQVYVMVGEYDKAFDQIEYLLSIPSELSVALLKLDPVWAPLRGLPRFHKLVEKY